MSAARADRNLLFGIIALQMDFIRQDALIAAMNAWVLAKDRPLGDILAEQGALKAEHRTLLDALVQMGARRSALHASGVGETDLAVQTGDGVKEAKNRRTVITLQP